MTKRWGVFIVNISKGSKSETRVTPENINAITPAAIDASTVVVATIRQPSKFGDNREEAQYRHIEVFEASANSNEPKDAKEKLTQSVRPLADHFNPFVIVDGNGLKHIGYHRCKVTDNIDEVTIQSTFTYTNYKINISNIEDSLTYRRFYND